MRRLDPQTPQVAFRTRYKVTLRDASTDRVVHEIEDVSCRATGIDFGERRFPASIDGEDLQGGDYIVSLLACNAWGRSPSDPIPARWTFTEVDRIAPAKLAVLNANEPVTFTWDEMPGADGYVLCLSPRLVTGREGNFLFERCDVQGTILPGQFTDIRCLRVGGIAIPGGKVTEFTAPATGLRAGASSWVVFACF